MMRSGLSSGNVAGHRKPHHSLLDFQTGGFKKSSRNGAAVRGKAPLQAKRRLSSTSSVFLPSVPFQTDRTRSFSP